VTIRLAWAALLSLAALLLWATPAQAYPQWQFSTGVTRCNQCHFSPAGGGLLKSFGRDAMADDLSTWQGNGNFLHGAVDLPAAVNLGADARLALVSHDNDGPDQPHTAIFPMQFDLYGRVDQGPFAVQATLGVRGQVRKTEAPIPASNFQSENQTRFVSREHWIAWQPAARGLYGRAGRFFAPFGLRPAEHLVYVRRDLGFNSLEETYGASVGYLENDWEGHFTLFAPDFLQDGHQETGAAAYAEKRLWKERAAVGLQAKYGHRDNVHKSIGGLIGKLFIAPINVLLMSEANLVRQSASGHGVGQFVGLFGASWMPPVRGLLLSLWGERLQGSFSTRDTSVNALMGTVSWFPYPHFELQIVGRVQGADGGDTFKTFLTQLHYFL
jgi:hypothetical protein